MAVKENPKLTIKAKIITKEEFTDILLNGTVENLKSIYCINTDFELLDTSDYNILELKEEIEGCAFIQLKV